MLFAILFIYLSIDFINIIEIVDIVNIKISRNYISLNNNFFDEIIEKNNNINNKFRFRYLYFKVKIEINLR